MENAAAAVAAPPTRTGTRHAKPVRIGRPATAVTAADSALKDPQPRRSLIAAVAAVVPTGPTVLTDRTVLIDPTAPTLAQAAAAAPTDRTALTGPIGLTALIVPIPAAAVAVVRIVPTDRIVLTGPTVLTGPMRAAAGGLTGPRTHDRRDDRWDRRDDRRDDRWDRRDDRRDRREDRSERRQDRREYREFRNRFNGDQWRRNWNRNHRSDWWRNDRRFRGYNGLRIGFYFAPGYGYYSVPRNYWGQRYHVGDYLPSIFWRYQLNDWRTYGLGYPPEGTRWVLVDNHIYLIDQYDGYIIDVIFDAWRW